MSVRKTPANSQAPMAMAATMVPTEAPVSDMSRLSLVLSTGAKEAAAREADAKGVKGGIKKKFKSREARAMADQSVQQAHGEKATVKERILTLAAKLNIHALMQFTHILNMSSAYVNVLMMTEGRIEKKTADYKQMMADNGYDLEAKLYSTDEGESYFQQIYAMMLKALKKSIDSSGTRLINDPEMFAKLQTVANNTAMKIFKYAGTELEQPSVDPGQAERADADATELVILNLRILYSPDDLAHWRF